jgi:hypothetical protein
MSRRGYQLGNNPTPEFSFVTAGSCMMVKKNNMLMLINISLDWDEHTWEIDTIVGKHPHCCTHFWCSICATLCHEGPIKGVKQRGRSSEIAD